MSSTTYVLRYTGSSSYTPAGKYVGRGGHATDDLDKALIVQKSKRSLSRFPEGSYVDWLPVKVTLA